MLRVFGAMRQPRTVLTFGLTVMLYLVLVVAEPFLHHSDACHATTPWHCTACSMQVTSPGVEDDTLLQAIALLPDAGNILPDTVPHALTPIVTRTQDRSPPPVAA